jgi:hypothetical protein
MTHATRHPNVHNHADHEKTCLNDSATLNQVSELDCIRPLTAPSPPKSKVVSLIRSTEKTLLDGLDHLFQTRLGLE